jgi:DNA-binding CsgD family transcriptional regulator
MITVADAELLEREAELDTLRAALADARDGHGGAVLVEGPAGQGKTTLLRAIRAEAAAEGMRVLYAVGAELERDYAFGIARQLFGTADGLTEHARAALEGPYEPALSPDICHARLHALFSIAASLAAEHPLAIVIDDAHWADSGTLKLLGVLARRLEDEPIALIVGTRPVEDDLMDALIAAPATTLLHPQPLSTDAVAHLMGAVEPEFAAAAAETTGGTPLLVRELRRMLAAGGYAGTAAEAEAVRRAVPRSITRLVQARLRRLGPDAVRLVRALAVLGDRATLASVEALAGLQSADAHVALAAAGLVEPFALRFTHPMMREATLATLVPAERSALHRRAAALLQDEAEIAAQLLASEPGDDPWAASVLAAAGSRALAAGDTDAARRLLRRAVEECRAPDPELWFALGQAEARAGDPAAHEHLREAARAEDPVIAARAEQALARVLIVSGRAYEAEAALRRGFERVRDADPRLAAELEDDLFDGLIYDASCAVERSRRLAEADERPVVLAHRAFDAAGEGAPADEVRSLARRALADGTLVANVERPAYLYAVEALMSVEAAEEAREALDAAAAAARRVGSRVAGAGVSLARMHWEHEFGHLDAARDAAQATREMQAGLSGRLPTSIVRAGLAAALLDAGDVDEAEQVLLGDRLPTRNIVLCGYDALRGRIHLERGRAEEAVAALEEQLANEAARGWAVSLRVPARATLVTALAESGRLDEALALADAELELQRRRGVAGAEARVLLARARLALARDEEIALLGQAVAAARRSPSALVQAEALSALGAALRRAGRRSDARDPLREARELAARTGAKRLEERAHEELLIAGARPQRVAQAGVDGLTPSERRVADLAAAGRRNREIAEELFVTLKTVEVHLGRAYGKLGITSRSQLASALGA